MIVATIEARTGSTRLPGKVLMPILGEPALARLVERLKRSRRVDAIVLATTSNPADDAVENLGRLLGVGVYRGSEDDVLNRVLHAAASVGADDIVEITGDCTLLCPEVVDRAVEIYSLGNYDVVSNTWETSYPQGIDAQVFRYDKLADAAQRSFEPAHREHVSLYFYEHPELYSIYRFQAPPEFRAPELRFQLDYPEDLAFIRSVYGELYPVNPKFSLGDIFELLSRKPELKDINAGCKEKAVR